MTCRKVSNKHLLDVVRINLVGYTHIHIYFKAIYSQMSDKTNTDVNIDLMEREIVSGQEIHGTIKLTMQVVLIVL